MIKSLRIEYSSMYELLEIFKKHPEEVEETEKLYAKANRIVDDLNMELATVTAEIVDEIVRARNIPPSAIQEIRRTEVAKDIRWKKTRKKLNEAIENLLILQGRSKGLFIRGKLLEMIGKAELRTTFEPVVYRDNRNPDTKVNTLENYLELPEEE